MGVDVKMSVSTAKSAKQECDVALKAAKNNLSSLKGEIKASKASLEESTQTLSDFVDGPLSNFNELRYGPKEEQEEKPEEKQEEKPEEKQEEKQEHKDADELMAEEPVSHEPQDEVLPDAAAPKEESPKEDPEKPREVEPTVA